MTLAIDIVDGQSFSNEVNCELHKVPKVHNVAFAIQYTLKVLYVTIPY